MRNDTRRLTCLALMVTFALLLSYVESRIPTLVAIPGVKVGLANIATVFALYKLGAKEAIAISAVRVVLVSLLFGNPVSMIYSLAGAMVSLSAMLLLKRFVAIKEVAVSVCGGVMHNVAQIAVAALILDTGVVAYYLPFLIFSGTVSGIAVGVAGALLIKRVRI